MIKFHLLCLFFSKIIKLQVFNISCLHTGRKLSFRFSRRQFFLNLLVEYAVVVCRPSPLEEKNRGIFFPKAGFTVENLRRREGEVISVMGDIIF